VLYRLRTNVQLDTRQKSAFCWNGGTPADGTSANPDCCGQVDNGNVYKAAAAAATVGETLDCRLTTSNAGRPVPLLPIYYSRDQPTGLVCVRTAELGRVRAVGPAVIQPQIRELTVGSGLALIVA